MKPKKIYKVSGIGIYLASSNPSPITVLAKYKKASIEVSFIYKKGELKEVAYKELSGKFPKRKLKILKEFISVHEHLISGYWYSFFVQKVKLKTDFLRGYYEADH